MFKRGDKVRVLQAMSNYGTPVDQSIFYTYVCKMNNEYEVESGNKKLLVSKIEPWEDTKKDEEWHEEIEDKLYYTENVEQAVFSLESVFKLLESAMEKDGYKVRSIGLNKNNHDKFMSLVIEKED